VATVLLVRHAAHDDLNCRLSGRGPAPGLNLAGLAQAHALARRLCDVPVAAIHSSPRIRAVETASAIAAECRLPIEVVSAIDEIDFGDWTGCRFEQLDSDPDWRVWNASRSSARPPNGESMQDAVARAETHIIAAADAHPDGTLVMVTHCDIVRGLLCRWRHQSLDRLLDFTIDPASVTRVLVQGAAVQLVSVNDGVAAPDRVAA
jgi:ribonuclease H / adenosylcobalamin/alpha-ribazole phosphatase